MKSTAWRGIENIIINIIDKNNFLIFIGYSMLNFKRL